MKFAVNKRNCGLTHSRRRFLDPYSKRSHVLPRFWCKHPIVLCNVGLLALMGLSPCSAKDKPALRVAPIFVHGDGEGSTGCGGLNPIGFLTEDEAREVIEDEAQKAGLAFTGRGRKLANVPIPYRENFVVWEDPKPDETPISATKAECIRMLTRRWISPENGFQKKSPVQTKKYLRTMDVELTGWNPQKQIGYRFVRPAEFGSCDSKRIINYEKGPDGTLKRISDFSPTDCASLVAAQRLSQGLQKVNEPGIVAVFYDPAGKVPANLRLREPRNDDSQATYMQIWNSYRDESKRREREAAAKNMGKDELRSQVKDFIAWLKRQGLI